VPVVQWRAGRAIQAVRTAVSEGLLGPSPTVAVDLALHRDAAYFEAGRAARAAWGCGALLSVGVHALDAVCFAFGVAPLDVGGALTPVGPGEGERAAVVFVTFAGGASAAVRITFEGGGDDETRMVFCGGGVTAAIEGTESDPTANRVRWETRDPATRARLERLERCAPGHLAAPLIVPYLGEAIEALRRGQAPGACPALPTIRDVRAAHDIALRTYAPTGHARESDPLFDVGGPAL
jgi:predicted dehydrogenase